MVCPPADSEFVPAHISRHDSCLEELAHEAEVGENLFVCHPRNRIIILRRPSDLVNGPGFHRGLWRAVDGDVVAELADFLVADDEDGFVLAQFGFAGDEQGLCAGCRV